MVYLDLFFFLEKHFFLSLCIAFGNETHNENYFLCIFIILSITWVLLTGPSPSSIWTDGTQQPSLQSGAEGCLCRKAAAATLHTCALRSHSFTQMALRKGVEPASSAGFMHLNAMTFWKTHFCQMAWTEKELTYVETAFFPFPLTFPHPSFPSVGTGISGQEALHTQAYNCNGLESNENHRLA